MNEHEICGRRGQPESLGGLQRGFRGRASERANRGRRQRGGAHLPKVCAVRGRVGARRRVASRRDLYSHSTVQQHACVRGEGPHKSTEITYASAHRVEL